MSDKFINQLPAATALSGSEPLPVMQGTATVQTTASAVLNQPTQAITAASATLTAAIQAAQGIFSGAITTGFFGVPGTIFVFDGPSLHTVWNLDASARQIFQFSRDDNNTTSVTLEVRGTGGQNLGVYKVGGSLQCSQGFGANGATAQTAHTVGAAVATTATTQTTPFGFTTQAQGDNLVALVNAIRLALVNNGICV